MLASVLAVGTGRLAAVPWYPLGPYGGHARAIAADPHNSQHLYLGTATGWVYESNDGGAKWSRLSMVAKRDDLVIDQIVLDALDPKHLTVGGWVIDHPDGGLYESHDGGRTWYSQAQMRGQSVRALAVAPSDPKTMVAGTLQGVYRTQDSGVHWTPISPAGSTEIHEVESIAIDPVDPNVIYAGTWHLPWKTVDGGANWTNIKQGIIDDSDVFSIIVDPASPQTVYASACSGIYKSLDAGSKFAKVQGIPSSARRTRKLAQDPMHPETVFAGTTEGLYRTLTAGTTWARLTPPDVIVNDVYIDPKNSNHLLIATERGGVMASEDGGATFQASNDGFTARQVTSFAADPRRASTVFVGLVNDKEAGGVFKSVDGGVTWQQQSEALNGRDVFSLAALGDGTILAGTSHGIFRMNTDAWTQSGAMVPVAPPVAEAAPAAHKRVVNPRERNVPPATGRSRSGARLKPMALVQYKAVTTKPVSKAAAKRASEKPVPIVAPAMVDATVYALVPVDDAIYAGTSKGLLKGDAEGKEWTDLPALELPEMRFVAAQKRVVMVASLRQIAVSADAGATWKLVDLPAGMTQVAAIAADDAGNVWTGGPEGVYYSSDLGASWKSLRSLYVNHVSGIYFDSAEHRVLVTANQSTTTFAAHVPDFKVSFWDTGWNLRFVRPAGDHLVGATMYDGIVVQPVMVDSKIMDTK